MNRKQLRKFFILSVLLYPLLSSSTFAQVSGCTDPTASNYNSSATVNNGSCLYNVSFYTPPVKVDPIDIVLKESSALELAGNTLWSLNDGGGAAAIYRIDSVTSTLLQTVTLEGATNKDWEDLAFDGTFLYIGDVGNNFDGSRGNFRIYKVPLSAIPDYVGNATVTIPSTNIEVINFTYSDQPQPVVATGPNNTEFDCAAMIVDEGKIHLFTKNWLQNKTTHYVINGIAAGTYVATPLETLATNYLVTAADKAPGKNLIVLLGYEVTGIGNHYLHLLSDYSGGLFFNGNKRQINLPNPSVMGQAEGLVFRTPTYGYISNERITGTVSGITYTVTQKLRSFDIAEFIPAYVLPLVLKKFEVVSSNGQNRITWNFSEPVKELVLQYSSNRTNFTTVQTFSMTSEGSFFHQPVTNTSFYRLAWKNEQGAERYSDIKFVGNSINNTVSNVVLRQNGELMFTKTGEEEGQYMFRLLSTDGKLVAQITEQDVPGGVHHLNFRKSLPLHTTFVLELIHRNERSAIRLVVQ